MRNSHRLRISLFVAFLACAMSLWRAEAVSAAVKDTDADGLTDQGETQIYHTDPNQADSDGDGVSDGQEIQNGTNPLDPSDSVPQVKGATEISAGILGSPEKFPWYFARAAGILAFILLTTSTAFGLIISSRAFMRFLPGVDAFEFHRSLSFSSIVAVILHFGSLFFDRAFGMTVPEALVPFFYSRTGIISSAGFELRIPLAFGVIAFYLIIVLVLTAEFRTNMAPKAWRIVHYASFAAYPLFVMHGYMSGTDSKEGWMRAIYLISVAFVALLVLVRIVSRTIMPVVRRLRSENGPKEHSPE